MSNGSESSRGGGILDAPVTCLITALNLGIFGIAWIKGVHHGESLTGETLVAFGANNRHLLWAGDYWRLLSSVFLHIGWIHLLFNMWSMAGWCAAIERSIGPGWFAFAYLTTGIGASACSALGHDVLSAGASGSGFGMIAVALSLLYRRAGSWEAFKHDPFARQIWKNAGIWMLIGVLGMMRMDNFAHAGGFLLGVAAGLLAGNRRGKHRPAWIAGLAAYVLVWGALVVAACIPGFGLGNRGIGP